MHKYLVVLSFLAMLGGMYTYSLLNSPKPASTAQVYESNCDLASSDCKVRISEELTLAFALNPKPILALAPLELTITTENLNDLSFKAWFEGRDMAMGQHYLIPEKNSENTAKQSVLLKGMIPICAVDNTMQWTLTIEFLHQNSLRHVQFKLIPGVAR